MTARASIAGAWLLASTLFAPGLALAEGKLAQLYAPRPPENAGFVRVLQPLDTALRVQVGNDPAQDLPAGSRASAYTVVVGDQPTALRLDDQGVGNVRVPAGQYQSVVLQDGKLQVMSDEAASDDALKAELRFYNLTSSCPGASLEVPDGPTLFSTVPPLSSQARAINPVSAQLRASCANVHTEALALPALQPGDHYALFLTGDGLSLTLRGELSRTAPFTR